MKNKLEEFVSKYLQLAMPAPLKLHGGHDLILQLVMQLMQDRAENEKSSTDVGKVQDRLMEAILTSTNLKARNV